MYSLPNMVFVQTCTKQGGHRTGDHEVCGPEFIAADRATVTTAEANFLRNAALLLETTLEWVTVCRAL